MATTEVKVLEAVLDPKWTWGTIRIGTVTMPFISVEHPRHGKLSFLVPRETMAEMKEGLAKVLEEKR